MVLDITNLMPYQLRYEAIQYFILVRVYMSYAP